jgi:predicted dehydrogenase
MSKVKVGLIGLGGMGSVHAGCYQKLREKDVELAAIADIDKDKRKKAVELYKSKAYKTGLELIEEADVDLIDICVPSYLHGVHALAAMDKKRAVVSEKPLCLNKAELNRLLKKQKETGANMAVAQCLRFWNEYEWLKNAAVKKPTGSSVPLR